MSKLKVVAKNTYTKIQFKKIVADEILLSGKVENGIKYLDKVVGEDWVYRLDLDRLNVNLKSVCITGQLFGDYWHFIGMSGVTVEEGRDLGFSIADNDLELKLGSTGKYIERYATLTRLWAEKIRALQAKRLK